MALASVVLVFVCVRGGESGGRKDGGAVPKTAALHLDEDFALLGLGDGDIVFEYHLGVWTWVLYECRCLGLGDVGHAVSTGAT